MEKKIASMQELNQVNLHYNEVRRALLHSIDWLLCSIENAKRYSFLMAADSSVIEFCIFSTFLPDDPLSALQIYTFKILAPLL